MLSCVKLSYNFMNHVSRPSAAAEEWSVALGHENLGSK